MNKKTASIQDMMELAIEQLEHGGMVELTVRGTSMRPFYHDQQTIVTLARKETIEKYDVVLYQNSQNQWVLHRVIAIQDDHYVTIGDAQVNKEIIPKQNVVAVVVTHKNKKIVRARSKRYLILVGIYHRLGIVKRIVRKFCK